MIEGLLSEIPGVVVYIGDILVTGKTTADYLAALDEVLKRLENAGLHLQRKKCFLMQPSVTYLRHLIDAQGLHPLPDKVQEFQEAPCTSKECCTTEVLLRTPHLPLEIISS